MFSSEEVAEQILRESGICFEVEVYLNLKSEVPVTSSKSKSKLNPLAKPFTISNKSIYTVSSASFDTAASGNNFDSSIDSYISSAILDCTPLIINDVMTPDMSMIHQNVEPLHIDDISGNYEESFMGRGNQELGEGKFLLNANAESFYPKSRNDLLPSDKTQPAVLKAPKRKINVDAPQSANFITQIDNDMDPKEMMELLKTKHRDRPIIAHLNINFLDPKFEPLKDMIKDNVDILLVSETKIDESYPEGRFFIEGYKEPIRLDRNKNGGGLLFFVHDDLECKEVKSHKLPK